MHFQVFGSASSLDLDLAVFVEEIPSIQGGKALCHHYMGLLSTSLKTSKELNVNVAVIRGGVLVDVYKGTVDELNNALYHTYDFHEQQHNQLITRLLPRDVNLKMLRCARKTLSFFSRTALRKVIKEALRGDFIQKINVLKTINLSKYSDFGRKGSLIEFNKTIAFQLGQTLGLMEGIELYTKETILEQYPDLELFLLRNPSANSTILQAFLNKFIHLAEERIPKMERLRE